MNSMKWLSCTVLAGGLVAAGCGGGGGTDMGPGDMGPHDTGVDTGMDGGTDSGPACTDPGATGMTKFYVVSLLSLPEATVDNVEPGFDIDHSTADVCMQMDWTSPAYQGSMPGVDNALAPLLSTLVGTAVQKSVDQGTVVLLLEVKGIDNFMNDGCVSATAYLGKLPMGATVMHAGTCPMGMEGMNAMCQLAPGQTFDIDSNSFADGMAGTMPRISFASASITNGRLHAGPVDFPLSIAIMGASLSITIHSAQIDMSISPTQVGIATDGTADGVLGGAIDDMQLLNTIASIPSLCSYVSVVGPLLGANSDLMPMPVTLSDGGMTTRCSQASIGISLGGVGAMRGAIVTTPATDGGTPMGCMDGGTSTDGGGPG